MKSIFCHKVPASDLVILNGKIYVNRFYKDGNGVVQSTLKDSVVLPSGYEKLDFVYNTSVDSTVAPNPIIETNFNLAISFGSIFLSWKNTTGTVSNYSPIFRTSYVNELTNITRLIHYMNSTTNFIINVNSNTRGGSTLINQSPTAFKISDSRTAEELAGSKTFNISGSQGRPQTNFKLNLLAKGADDKLHYFFVVDHNGYVTFTVIPCRNGSSYGLYDLVTDTFYTDACLGA